MISCDELLNPERLDEDGSACAPIAGSKGSRRLCLVLSGAALRSLFSVLRKVWVPALVHRDLALRSSVEWKRPEPPDTSQQNPLSHAAKRGRVQRCGYRWGAFWLRSWVLLGRGALIAVDGGERARGVAREPRTMGC
jgi:hypothetical protein